jgi:hypothetical protein
MQASDGYKLSQKAVRRLTKSRQAKKDRAVFFITIIANQILSV